MKLVKEANEKRNKLDVILSGTSDELLLIIKELGLSEGSKKKLSLLLSDDLLKPIEEEKKEEKKEENKEEDKEEKLKSPREQLSNYEGWLRDYETEEEAKTHLSKMRMERGKCYIADVSSMKLGENWGNGIMLWRDQVSGRSYKSYHITSTSFISARGRCPLKNLEDIIGEYMFN